MRFCLIWLSLFSLQVWAQYSEQPVKESSADLRDQSVLFKIEMVKDQQVFWLERTTNLDYFLRMSKKGDESIKKIDSRSAKKLDMDFASRFLRCQYELPSLEGDCQLTLRLTMKGELQDICGKDEKKSQEIVTFLDELKKQF